MGHPVLINLLIFLQENNKLFPKIDIKCNIIERHPQIELGSATLSAVALSFIFMAVHWFKLENTWMKKLKTLPILLFHFFPQYRAFRVLYFWWKGDTEKWSKEKLVLERDISSIGKKIYALQGFVAIKYWDEKVEGQAAIFVNSKLDIYLTVQTT